MIQFTKIDLNKKWLDKDWDLFENTFTTVSKTQFVSDNVYEIVYDNNTIGLVELDFFVDEKVCHIAEFEIQRTYRHKGYGLMVVKELLVQLKDITDFKRIELCPKNNSIAIFWMKCGFQYFTNSNETMYKFNN